MIDPGEALLVVLGMRPLISHEIETITETDWRRVMNLEHEIDDAARDLVTGHPAPAPDRGTIEYMSVLQGLVTPYDEHQVEAMLEQLPPWFGESAGSFLAASHRAFAFMGSHCPRQVLTDLTGPKPIHPPERLVDGFIALLQVLDDVPVALRLAANAQLSKAQLQALDDVFPMTMRYMRDSVQYEITEAKAADPRFRLAYPAEMGAEKLLGVSLGNPALAKMLAASPPKPAQPPGGPPSQAKAPEQMTRVQRTDNLQVG